MLTKNSWLRICDNSGAILARVIHVYKPQTRGVVHDLVSVIPKTAYSATKRKLKMKVNTIYKALIVRTKSTNIRKTGYSVSMRSNAAILFGVGPTYIKAGVYLPVAKRIYGPVMLELRYKGNFARLATMARRMV